MHPDASFYKMRRGRLAHRVRPDPNKLHPSMIIEVRRSTFEPGSNVNWTFRTRPGAFGPRFNHMAEPEPAFGSAFANFGQALD